MRSKLDITLYKDDFKNEETFLDTIRNPIVSLSHKAEIIEYLENNLVCSVIIHTETREVTFEQ